MPKARIIDAHVHLYHSRVTPGVRRFIDGYSKKVEPQIAHFVEGLPEHFDAANYLTHAQPHGVMAAVNLPVAHKEATAVDVRRLNNYCAQMMRDFPGRIFSFGSINPHLNIQEIRAELKRIRDELGLLGIKLHPIRSKEPRTFQEFDPLDDKLKDVYRAIADAGLRILWHAGSPDPDDLTFNATPPKLRRIKERYFSGRQMDVAHFCGMGVPWKHVLEYLGDQDGLIFDGAYTGFGLKDATLVQIVGDVGSSRVRVGSSDFPYMSVNKMLEGLAGMGLGKLSSEDQDRVLFQNAVEQLGLGLAV